MKKKGQGAMEFLMTYGWAILVVLVVLGALFFLGVFNPKTTSGCKLDAPFVCKDFQVKENGVVFSIGSKNIQSGEVSSITVNGEVCSVTNKDLVNNQVVNVECIGVNPSGKVSADIVIDYVKKSGLSHTEVGKGSGEVEEGVIEGLVIDDTTILYLRFSDDSNPTIDESEYSNDGTCNGDACPIWTSEGKVGGGFEFDGVNDYFSFESLQSVINISTDDFTVSAWIKQDSAGFVCAVGMGGYLSGMIMDRGINNARGLVAWYNIEGVLKSFYYAFPGVTGTDPISEWMHIVVVKRSIATWDVYGNGELIETNNYDHLGSLRDQPNLRIGKCRDNREWKGSVDEVRIWDKALSPEEVETLYNSY